MGKHCDRWLHVNACISAFFALLSCIAYFVIQGLRDQILLDIGEYSEVVHEWSTVPFTEIAIMEQTRSCPLTHPALVVYDVWPGLDINCYCTPSAEFTTEYGQKCSGARAESTKCFTRNALPTMYLGVLNCYKICGKRDGEPFYRVQRPIADDKGRL